MELLIDGDGELWDARGENLARAVWEFGQIRLTIREVAEVEILLAPAIVNRQSVAEALRIVAGLAPARIVLSVDAAIPHTAEFAWASEAREKINDLMLESEKGFGQS